MMSKRRQGIILGVVLTITLAVSGTVASAQDTEVLYLDEVADLDLHGNIIYAVNFGNNGNPTVGGVAFSSHGIVSGLTVAAASAQLAEGADASWWGPSPGTGDADLDRLLRSAVATWTPPWEISIEAQGLVPGTPYLLQVMGYEPESHGRSVDLLVENEEIVTGLSPIDVQQGAVGQGGFLIKHTFTATDSTMNMLMVNHMNACGMSGLILTELAAPVRAFTDCGSGTTIELAVGKGVWQINWGQGPWTWSEDTGQALLDSNVSSLLDLHTTAPAEISDDLVATLPIAGELTLCAHDPNNKDIIIGEMVLNGTGVNVIDINGSRVIVDEGSGMVFAPFHAPDPRLTLTLQEATGVFAHIGQVGDWEMQLAGSYAAPLIRGAELQDSIFAALGGNVPLIGGIGEFFLTGQYESDESKKAKRFCEHGVGVSARLGAGGALWDQVWASGPWAWHECPEHATAQLLGDNVSGELETTTAGAPSIDENMILSFDFGGHMTLISQSTGDRNGSDGRILGDVDGTFVADINAEHATLDADGNIVIAFGTSVHDAPDALITVTEATGIYADIQQAGQWAWYVDGTMTIARVPDLPLQDNILAALQNSDLLLGAEEEFVLTGWYHEDAQTQE